MKRVEQKEGQERVVDLCLKTARRVRQVVAPKPLSNEFKTKVRRAAQERSDKQKQ